MLNQFLYSPWSEARKQQARQARRKARERQRREEGQAAEEEEDGVEGAEGGGGGDKAAMAPALVEDLQVRPRHLFLPLFFVSFLPEGGEVVA